MTEHHPLITDQQIEQARIAAQLLTTTLRAIADPNDIVMISVSPAGITVEHRVTLEHTSRPSSTEIIVTELRVPIALVETTPARWHRLRDDHADTWPDPGSTVEIVSNTSGRWMTRVVVVGEPLTDDIGEIRNMRVLRDVTGLRELEVDRHPDLQRNVGTDPSTWWRLARAPEVIDRRPVDRMTPVHKS